MSPGSTSGAKAGTDPESRNTADGMKRTLLGRTGIEVSRLGFGTGTAHPGGRTAQSLMSPGDLAGLLRHGLELGINFWDTALAYGTHRHVREALRDIRRDEVVIATKLITSERKETEEALRRSLQELGSDYVDICLVHGVRTAGELKRREGALESLAEAKWKGKVRAVGLSSHGLGALRAAASLGGIDVVWGRVNIAGLCMDSCEPRLYDRMASVPWLNKAVKKAVPARIRAAIRPGPEEEAVGESGREDVESALGELHRRSVGVVGMKVLAEGALRERVDEAVGYVRSLPFVHAFIIGMTTREEVERNSRLA